MYDYLIFSHALKKQDLSNPYFKRDQATDKKLMSFQTKNAIYFNEQLIDWIVSETYIRSFLYHHRSL